jgi:cellulase
MKFLTLAAIAATLIAEVSAKGSRVWSVWIGGTDQGPGAGVYIRQPQTNDPVKNLTSGDITCNTNGYLPVSSYVHVPAGGTVTTEWCTYVPSPADQ